MWKSLKFDYHQDRSTQTKGVKNIVSALARLWPSSLLLHTLSVTQRASTGSTRVGRSVQRLDRARILPQGGNRREKISRKHSLNTLSLVEMKIYETITRKNLILVVFSPNSQYWTKFLQALRWSEFFGDFSPKHTSVRMGHHWLQRSS